VETGTELEDFLLANSHVSVDKDNVSQIKQAVKTYVDTWNIGGLEDKQTISPFTVEATVNTLIKAVSDIYAAKERDTHET
jgi:hypothetical protein